MHRELYQTFLNFHNRFFPDDYDTGLKVFFESLLYVVSAKTFVLDMEKSKYLHSDYINHIISGLDLEAINPDFIGLAFEKAVNRKRTGTYYTPKFVTEYVVETAFKDIHKKMDIYDISILDPSSGSGEFLVTAFKKLLNTYKIQHNSITEEEIILLSKQIYGVDINDIAIEIARFRLIFTALEYGLNIKKIENLEFHLYVGNSVLGNCIEEKESLEKIYAKQLTSLSFDTWIDKCKPFNWSKIGKKFKIIIGNPPYIELSKIKEYQPNLSSSKSGNIFSPFIERATTLLDEGGVLGFILPISFSSTKRMKEVRDIVYSSAEKIQLLSFADRPASLFQGVHQKLNILFFKKSVNKNIPSVLTNAYTHFYTDEIKGIFESLKLVENPYFNFDIVPKIGSSSQLNLLNKVLNIKKEYSIFETKNPSFFLYLNSRSCFWMKAFLNQPISSDYLKIGFDSEEQMRHAYAILNSSLFFWFWEVISDGWHIRKSDLMKFDFKHHKPSLELVELSYTIEREIEATKVFVGSKQVEYEYRHKSVKSFIDKIDYVLADIYDLSGEDVDFIIMYNSKYRMNDEFKNYLLEVNQL